jgi:sigma-B regulation protein RsbU (phosphoserine phosphatase)
VSGVEALLRSPYFGGVSSESLAAILRAGTARDVARGEAVLRPGDEHGSLFLVLEGSFEVRLEEAAGTVSSVAAGECFGEMALVEGRPASAFVVATSAARVLRVPAERVFGELLPMPGFARGLLRLMSERLRQNLGRQASWEQVRKELRIARDMQSSMLPPAGVLFPDRPEVDCAAAMEPAAEVGGDFYDAFFLDERYLFFAVGDVSGKGMGAALFMARSLTLLRSESLRRRSLSELLTRVNEALLNDQATFVSLFCGVLDCWSGTLRYANGGGLAPWLHAGGRWSRLPMPRGLVVGAIPGFAFESARARLAPGDTLVLFSDGVTEARSPFGELFGDARLRGVLEEAGPSTAPDLVERVRGGVSAFAAGSPIADDLTLLVVRRPGEDASREAGR